VALSSEAEEFLLSSAIVREQRHQDFVENRLCSNNTPFSEPIKRVKVQGFNTQFKRSLIKDKRTVDINRDVLAKLLAISMKQEKIIDFQKALKYSLRELSLSLCNPDGTMRKTNKSKLLKNISSRTMDTIKTTFERDTTALIIDLMALIRTATNIAETFERYVWKLVNMIPKGY
jgi:hypothetical protein